MTTIHPSRPGGHHRGPWTVGLHPHRWRVHPNRRVWYARTPNHGPDRSGPDAAPEAPPPTSPDHGSGPVPEERAVQLVDSFARALARAHNGEVQHEREHGDRRDFLATARRQLATAGPANRVHALLPLGADASVPRPVYSTADPGADRDELVASFARSVEDAGGRCHIVTGEVPGSLLDELVSDHDAWEATVSAEPEAREIAERLTARGVEILDTTPENAARAGIGVTSARAGIAATGSVVLDSSQSPGRTVSVLPPVHLCILAADRLVASPAEVLRPLGRSGELPSSLVLVTGPSRSGDIEQILTIGAHGPTALHVVVVT